MSSSESQKLKCYFNIETSNIDELKWRCGKFDRHLLKLFLVNFTKKKKKKASFNVFMFLLKKAQNLNPNKFKKNKKALKMIFYRLQKAFVPTHAVRSYLLGLFATFTKP